MNIVRGIQKKPMSNGPKMGFTFFCRVLSFWAQYVLDDLAVLSPHISLTIWRTEGDQKNKCYYFGSATSPNIFWVLMADLELSEGAPIKKLTLAGGKKVYAGNASPAFKPAESFVFMSAGLNLLPDT